MRFNKKTLITNLLKNERIHNRIQELQLNKKQIEEALPILIDMNNENPNAKLKYLTSFFLTTNGSVKRMEVLSKYGQKFLFEKNILTQHLYKLDFEENDKYFQDETRSKLLFKFVNFLKNNAQSKGFYIYGSMGIGKTFTMKKFVKKLAQNNKKVGFIHLPALIDKLKKSFNLPEEYNKIFTTLIKVDILFIDDIGAEIISQWFRDGFLFEILNTRMDKHKTTFFASNYSLIQLKKIEAKNFNSTYKDFDKAARLIDRIKALSDPFFLTGKNYRY